MGRYRSVLCVAMALGLALLAGCVHPISAQLRREAQKGLAPSRVAEDPGNYQQATVVWGGVILGVEPRADHTALLVEEHALDWDGEPNLWTESKGLFEIDVPVFLDPEGYVAGRLVTVGGEIRGLKNVPDGETDITRFPEVTAREFHIWESYPTAGVYPPYWVFEGWRPWDVNYAYLPYYYYRRDQPFARPLVFDRPFIAPYRPYFGGWIGRPFFSHLTDGGGFYLGCGQWQ